ncbi:MAG: PQQ-binding-like beta-propeller repeat protein [Gemmataceae bacterium]
MKRLFVLSLVFSALSAFSAVQLLAADWIHWRGPTQNGVAFDTNLPDTFGLDPADPKSNLIWKAPYGCRSTPLVMKGKVYIINSDGAGINEGERVMAFDAQTGKVLWEHKFNVFHTDIVSSRVGWANLSADPETGYVYAHGTQGFLWCLNGESGHPVWVHSLTEEYGRVTGYGGRIVSPTVHGDLVILGMINASWGDQARGANRFVAFDKKTGAVRWWSSPAEKIEGTYYSNPIITNINGQEQLITGAADGQVIGMNVHTGAKLWSYRISAKVINTGPVFDGPLIYVTHGEENVDVGEQGRIVCLDASLVKDGAPKLVWEKVGIKAGLASPAFHDGKLYVPDDGAMLHCFDGKTGNRLWKFKYGRVARGAPVWADSKVYVAEVNAKFHILKPSDSSCKELYAQSFFSSDGTLVETNGTPAVSNRRIFFGTRDEVYCVGGPWAETLAPTPQQSVTVQEYKPDTPDESKGSTKSVPATLLVQPCDVILAPGEATTLSVDRRDAAGKPIAIGSDVKVEWSLPLPPKTPAGAQPPALRGKIENGVLTVVKEVPGQFGYVEAKVGNLTARARVRVAPKLPYKLDLSKVPVGATPGGWINAQGKFEVVEKDGKHLLKKLAINPSPPVAKINSYITMPDAHEYTVQADVMCTEVNKNMPDHGLVNSRYTFQMAGNMQNIRISTWDAMPRLEKTLPFTWKAGTWYRMKFTVEQQDKTAICRGKVWPRDEQEPANWMVEIEDPRPNRSGSAGLYAYATGIVEPNPGAESYFDNISVVPNEIKK